MSESLIGALVGAGIGWLDYLLVVRILDGKLRADVRSSAIDRHDELKRRYLRLRSVLFVVAVVGFAVVGFFFGRAAVE